MKVKCIETFEEKTWPFGRPPEFGPYPEVGKIYTVYRQRDTNEILIQTSSTALMLWWHMDHFKEII